MQENIYLQIYVFLFTLYGGIVIGIIYDLVDILLNGYIISKRSLTDVLFWLIAFFIIIAILFYTNDITFRGYTFVGFGSGWLIYFFTLSKIIRILLNYLRKIMSIIIKNISALILCIVKPIGLLFAHCKSRSNKLRMIYRKVGNDFKKYKRYLFRN